MKSIYIEMFILATCFGVTLAAVWLNHKAQVKLEYTEEALTQVLKENQDLETANKYWREKAEMWEECYKNKPETERCIDVEQANA